MLYANRLTSNVDVGSISEQSLDYRRLDGLDRYVERCIVVLQIKRVGYKTLVEYTVYTCHAFQQLRNRRCKVFGTVKYILNPLYVSVKKKN